MRIPKVRIKARGLNGLPVASYLSEVRSELKKVEWPKRREVVKLTIIIVIISAVVGGYLGVLDLAMTKFLEAIVAK